MDRRVSCGVCDCTVTEICTTHDSKTEMLLFLHNPEQLRKKIPCGFFHTSHVFILCNSKFTKERRTRDSFRFLLVSFFLCIFHVAYRRLWILIFLMWVMAVLIKICEDLIRMLGWIYKQEKPTGTGTAFY